MAGGPADQQAAGKGTESQWIPSESRPVLSACAHGTSGTSRATQEEQSLGLHGAKNVARPVEVARRIHLARRSIAERRVQSVSHRAVGRGKRERLAAIERGGHHA